MTFEQLIQRIVREYVENKVPIRNFDATVRVNGEFYKIKSFEINVENDVLDEGHPFLTVEE